jgi:hypothetical protein
LCPEWANQADLSLAIGHDVFAEAAIDVRRLQYTIVEELYPLFGRFVM